MTVIRIIEAKNTGLIFQSFQVHFSERRGIGKEVVESVKDYALLSEDSNEMHVDREFGRLPSYGSDTGAVPYSAESLR